MRHLKKIRSQFKLNRYLIIFIAICAVTGFIKQMALLFLFVSLHELSHVIAAWSFKLRIESVELFPFGGVAKIDNLESASSYKEIIIACAGPACNAAIALIVLILSKAGVDIPDFRYIMNINISLALFNLLPGLPLDGGRILRASLKYYIGFKKATRTAALCGKIISVILLIAGFMSYFLSEINLSLIAVPFFVFISADNEEKSIMYTIMKDIVIKNKYILDKGIMESYGLCVYEDVYVRDILKHFDLNMYHIIYIINNDMELMGILTESQILEGLSSQPGDITVKELYRLLNK